MKRKTERETRTQNRKNSNMPPILHFTPLLPLTPSSPLNAHYHLRCHSASSGVAPRGDNGRRGASYSSSAAENEVVRGRCTSQAIDLLVGDERRLEGTGGGIGGVGGRGGAEGEGVGRGRRGNRRAWGEGEGRGGREWTEREGVREKGCGREGVREREGWMG